MDENSTLTSWLRGLVTLATAVAAAPAAAAAAVSCQLLWTRLMLCGWVVLDGGAVMLDGGAVMLVLCLRTAPADCSGLRAPSFEEVLPPCRLSDLWFLICLARPPLTAASPPFVGGAFPAASGRTVGGQCGRSRSRARHTGNPACLASSAVQSQITFLRAPRSSFVCSGALCLMLLPCRLPLRPFFAPASAVAVVSSVACSCAAAAFFRAFFCFAFRQPCSLDHSL